MSEFFFVGFLAAFVRFSLTCAIFFMRIFVVTSYFCYSSVSFIRLAECGYLIHYVQHVLCCMLFFWVVQCVMGNSVCVGQIVVNTDSYIIVSPVGFQASETYCVVVFLLQFVLDFIVQIVVVEGVLGGCGTPFTYDKDVVNVRILCFCSLSCWGSNILPGSTGRILPIRYIQGNQSVFHYFASNIRCLL